MRVHWPWHISVVVIVVVILDVDDVIVSSLSWLIMVTSVGNLFMRRDASMSHVSDTSEPPNPCFVVYGEERGRCVVMLMVMQARAIAEPIVKAIKVTGFSMN